jgi:hypothetical protein
LEVQEGEDGGWFGASDGVFEEVGGRKIRGGRRKDATGVGEVV